MKSAVLLIVTLVWALPAGAAGPWCIDLEAAMVTAESNDVAIPNQTGTRLSLTSDLTTDDDVAFRIGLGHRIGQRNRITVLYAPLRLYARGAVDFPIDFNGESFAADEDLRAVSQYNNYRLSWTYDLVQYDNLELGLGLTANVRDAYIELSDATTTSRYDDLGFVPLLNLRFDWRWHRKLGLLIEADGAVAPGGKGRAEDVLLALTIRPWGQGTFRLGYRFREGGVDIADIYSFAYISSYVFGWRQQF